MQRIATFAVILSLAAGQGWAQSSSSKSRTKLFSSQTKLLDSRLSKQYEFSSRLLPKTATAGIPAFRGQYKGPYLQLAKDAALKHGVPTDLFLRLVQQESGWNAQAVSPKGAIGLAQLMPGTAELMGVNPEIPVANLDGGAKYLRRMYDKFGSWRLALAAYNAGPEAVLKYDGIPPYPETQGYVKAILGS